jgi:hypothetical protein
MQEILFQGKLMKINKMNNKNRCKKIREWIILNKGSSTPDFIKKHIKDCSDCNRLYFEENILLKFVNLQTMKEMVPPEVDWKVKAVLPEIAKKFEKPTYRRAKLFPKVAVSMILCIFLISMFYLPLYHGENFFGNKINNDFGITLSRLTSLQTLDITSTSNTVDKSTNNAVNDLKFINSLYVSNNDKDFYYTHSDLTKDKHLLISFLSEKTGKSTEEIYNLLLSNDYALVLRSLKLPYKKTLEEFINFTRKYTDLSRVKFAGIEGIVTSIDFINKQFYIDSLLRPVKVDLGNINLPLPDEYIHVNFYEKDNILYCDSISVSDYPTKIITGKINKIDKKDIYLTDTIKPIHITNGTIIKNNNKFEDINVLLNKDVKIRTVTFNENISAISVLNSIIGSEKLLSGEIAQIFKNGFTLKNSNLSFYYLKSYDVLQNKILSNIKIGDFISVKGIFFDNMLKIVKVVEFNSNIKIKKPNEYLLVSNKTQKNSLVSSKTNVLFSEDRIDYIVGINNNEFILKSGKIIKNNFAKTYPVGSKINISVNRSSQQINEIKLLDYGTISKLSTQYKVVKTLNNNVINILSLKDKRHIFIYSKNIKDITENSIIQAKIVDYENFSVCIDYRVFNLNKLVSIKGYITKELEQNKTYLLDNGYIFTYDEFSEIKGEIPKVGNIVNINGILSDGKITGYIVNTEKEFVLISGTIVEINIKLKYIKLDSNITIKYDDNTVFNPQNNQLKVNDKIVCKVYYDGETYIANEIYFSKDYPGGVNI